MALSFPREFIPFLQTEQGSIYRDWSNVFLGPHQTLFF